MLNARSQLIVILHEGTARTTVRSGTDKAVLSRNSLKSHLPFSSPLFYFVYSFHFNMTPGTIQAECEPRELDESPPSKAPSPYVAPDTETLETGMCPLQKIAHGVTDVSSLDVSQPSEQLPSSTPGSSGTNKSSIKRNRASKGARKRIREEREQRRREGVE